MKTYAVGKTRTAGGNGDTHGDLIFKKLVLFKKNEPPEAMGTRTESLYLIETSYNI